MVNVRLAGGLSLFVACAGCTGTPSDRDTLPPPSHRVTARVVDTASGRTDPSGSRAAPIAAAPSDVSIAPPSPANKTPESIRVEAYTAEDSARPAENRAPTRPEESAANPEEQFLLRVAVERPAVPLDGSINGEPVLAGFIGGDTQCSRLAVSYPARRVSEIWRVCADRQFILERKAEPTPTVPDDPALEPSRLMAVRSAYYEGRATFPYGPMTISAQANGQPDARGCMLVRSALSWQGIPMATADETICAPSGD